MAHLGSLNITEKMKQLLKVIERVHGNHIGIPKQYKMFHKKKKTCFPKNKKACRDRWQTQMTLRKSFI